MSLMLVYAVPTTSAGSSAIASSRSPASVDGLIGSRTGWAFAAAASRVPATPPTLWLPFAWHSSWWANGPHSDNGESGTRNNVDLGPGGDGVDGDALAAAAGVAHVHACPPGLGWYVRVDHGNGWMTQYWHLGSVASGLDGRTEVTPGTYLGSTAIKCGNPSPFSHVHFGLFGPGQPYPLDGVSVGGYTIHAGTGQYNGWWTRNRDGVIVHQTTNELASCCVPNDQLPFPVFAR